MELQFRPYAPADRAACLRLFDANCPDYFAPNERDDYAAFLADAPVGYEVCTVAGAIVGASGVLEEDGELALRWILIAPFSQGAGIGRAMMQRALAATQALRRDRLRIAASHKSAGFFARFGAREVSRTPDGWGPGMHRVDMVVIADGTTAR